MQRRQFLCRCAAGLGGAALSALSPRLAKAGPSRPDLAIVRATDYKAAVVRAVEALGGFGLFVRKGETVLIKPNVGWKRTVEQGANTHPDVVAAVVSACRAAGARRVIVADRTCHNAESAFERSGVAAAAKAAGAEVIYEDLSFSRRNFSGGLVKEWELLDLYIEADKVINVPVVKHHALSGMTCAMKNWLGVVGGKRALMHADIHTAITDLAAACVPSLTVVDATRVLLTNGPTGGSVDDVKTMNLVAAGYDQVACDGWACSLMDKKWTDFGYLKQAAKRGIGQPDVNKLILERFEL